MSQSQFDAAVQYVRSLPKDSSFKMSDETKLKLYAFYKQATEGPVTGSQPWAVQVEARAKWNARKAIEGMSKEEAMANYVALLMELTRGAGCPWNP